MSEYVDIPSWAYTDTDNSIYSLVTAIVLSGHENKWIKIRAKQQRDIIGANRFNRKSVGVFDGQLHVGYSVCFGTDFNSYPITPEDWDSGKEFN